MFEISCILYEKVLQDSASNTRTIPFALYDFQTKTLESFRDEQFNIVLKARQMGISTLVSGYALWLMTFFTDKSILCIAITKKLQKHCYKSNSYVSYAKLVTK